MKNAYCSYCGSAFQAEQPWPRECASCGKITYLNPLPVAVGVVPIEDGLLVIRRLVEPRIGSLALPGGFINMGESWQQACVREIEEETGLQTDAGGVRLYDVLSAPDGTVLIFGILPPRPAADLPAFTPNAETSEMTIIREPMELAFPLHTRVAARFFAEGLERES